MAETVREYSAVRRRTQQWENTVIMKDISNIEYRGAASLPGHDSRKHPLMPVEKRAAQFAPFAALTGYEDSIEETRKGAVTAAENEITREEFFDE